MVENSRRERVGLGLIGLGPSWEKTYRQTLARLQHRLTIRVIYDPVEARAKSVASEFGAKVVGSLWQILNRKSLQGLIVLDPGWCGAGTLELLSRCGKPVYLASALLRHISEFSTVEQANGNNVDDLLMPELGLRFTPSSCRLRELIATKLGRVEHLQIDCDLAGEIDDVAEIIDWCFDQLGHPPTLSTKVDRSSMIDGIDFEFPPTLSTIPPSPLRTVKLRHRLSDDSWSKIEVHCERGRASLSNRTEIRWETASESANESLTDERTEIDILIDQFCRRALGGLNPVGRLSDFARAMAIVEAVRAS